MSKEFLEMLQSMDIRVYGTISGKIYIGEKHETHEDSITLNNPLRIVHEGNSYSFATAVPGEYVKSTITIFNRAVEFQSVARLRLKKDYLDYIMSTVINGMDMNMYPDLDPLDTANAYWNELDKRLKR